MDSCGIGLVGCLPGVSGRTQLYDFELEPEVCDWLDSLSDSDFKRVDEVCGLLAEKGARVTYWCTADGRIVLLTVFRKARLPYSLGPPARAGR